MFLTRSEYDRGVNTFSPEGRLFQVEYAIEAIKLGSTAVGVRCKDGVVLAVEKRVTSPLLEPSSIEKVAEIDEHIGCAMSGLTADARTLIDHARVETQQHRFSYNEPMPVESCTQSLCDLALRFGDGDDEGGIESSLWRGATHRGMGRGRASPVAHGPFGHLCQESFRKDLTLAEAEVLALATLKQVMEEKVTPTNVDIASVAPKYHLYTQAEIEVVIARL
ncbi:hypothetical protein WJX72_008250 [[Myrmecia] bisecta]|uniref:Proteasome subunit alpha type n=1 Tax=[Myrmecia] bisecta TaxID=41462 RepID=A0AAW1QFM6_9CHLO